MRAQAAAAALLLVACTPLSPAPGPRAEARGLVPDAGGLQPGGTPLRIDFGREQAGVVAAVSRILGSPPDATSLREGCAGGGDTFVTWPGGLTLAFASGAFVGWRDAQGRSAGAVCEAA